MTTLEEFIEIPKARAVPKPKIIVDGISAADAKRINPYSAPTFEGFQNSYRAKYGKMPRGSEINQWYAEHPGEWERRHGKGVKRR